MKKVTAKLFFSVMWRGICQSLGWFFGLFGYKRDGKFAKCVWGVFAVSAAIIMALLASAGIYGLYEAISRKCYWDNDHEYDGGQYISRTIGYVSDYDWGNGYLVNKKTGDKVLKGINWIAKPLDNDTLICFSKGTKRGYFNMKDGKVVIEPKYDHAWIFSDGVAAVEENGQIKFIDGTGKVVIDAGIGYDPLKDDYVFHGGYLIVSDDHHRYGLMDLSGKFVLEKEYDYIAVATNQKYWCVYKDNQCAVYDKGLNKILPYIEGSVSLGCDAINVTMPDHTIRKYDYNGNLIDDFYISEVLTLEYEKDEVLYRSTTVDENGDEYAEPFVESYHPKATARLRVYVAGDDYQGLMTADGHIVTMPLYENIEAIGYDTYLCTVNNDDKVVVNGKGEVVK